REDSAQSLHGVRGAARNSVRRIPQSALAYLAPGWQSPSIEPACHCDRQKTTRDMSDAALKAGKSREEIAAAYSSPPLWYDIRGFFILTFAYNSTLPRQLRF